MTRCCCALGALLLGCALAGSRDAAAAVNWIAGSSANWSDGGNWQSGVTKPYTPVNGDDLTFTASGYTGATTLTDDLLSLTSIASVRFNLASYTGPFTINASNGAALALTGSLSDLNTSPNFSGKYYNVLFNVPLTINSGTIAYTGAAGNGLALGALTNKATFKVDDTKSYGVWVTGQYTGAGSGAAATDVLISNGNHVGDQGNPAGLVATPVSGDGGITIANGLTNNIGTLDLGQAANHSIFSVDGGSTVHVTKGFNIYHAGSTGATLEVRNGSALVIDSTATIGYNATPVATVSVQLTIGGDGNANNVVDFQSTTLDLGAYAMPHGDTQVNYNGATLIGGLNLITHGATWTLYGGKNYGLTFGGVDGGGWTVKDNSLTVKGNGVAGNAAVTFNNNRFLDVESSSLTLDNATAGFGGGLVIASGKTVSKIGPGALNLNVPTAGGGSLAVQAGTAKLANSAFAAGLAVSDAGYAQFTGGTSIHVNSLAVGGHVLSGGSDGGELRLGPSDATAATIWNVSGDLNLANGAVLDVNVFGADAAQTSDQILLGGWIGLSPGAFMLNVTSTAPLAQDLTLIQGASSLLGSVGSWTVSLNGAADATDTVQQFGNNLVLHHAVVPLTPTWAIDGGGNWSTAANWSGGTPGGVDAEADFGEVAPGASANPMVAVDQSGLVAGILKFNTTGGKSYSVSTAAQPLTLEASAGPASIQVLSGSHQIVGAEGIVLHSDLDVNVADGASLTLQNVAGEGKNLIGSGPGTLTIIGTHNDYSGTSSFSGIVNIGDGTAPATLAGTTQITLSGTLHVNANSANPFTAQPDLIDNGTLNLHADAQFGTITGTAAAIQLDSGTTLTLGRDGASDNTITQQLLGSNVTLHKVGDNTLVLTAENATTWTGAASSLSIDAGRVVAALLPDSLQPNQAAVPVPVAIQAGGTFALPGAIDSHFDSAFSGTGRLEIATGAVALTGDGSGFSGQLAIQSGTQATLALSAALNSAASIANDGTLNIGRADAAATLAVGQLSGSGDTLVAPNSSLTVARLQQHQLSIQGDAAHAAAVLTVAASGVDAAGDAAAVSVLDSLSIANDGGALGSRAYYGSFDLENNDLIVNNLDAVAAADTLLQLTDLIRAGFSGDGLLSSASSTITGLAAVNNTAGAAAFDGVSIDANATLVKFTYFGDLNLDGIVDGNEIAAAVNGFNLQLGGWENGDANYSGTVDGNDLASIVNAFNGQNALSTPLPEPSGWTLAVGALAALLGGRRRANG
ncbi:MAG TPA: hypothetical protein VFE24_09790 [Pirellulales bacterium]|jgi:autotransporter family porin|nr:hypothetical protein [Pirellulales bacterium]